MKKQNPALSVILLLLILFMPYLSHADPCTEQGGTRHGTLCRCGDKVFDPQTHHCLDTGTGAARKTKVQAGHIKLCSVCTEGIEAGNVRVACSSGHETDTGDCLIALVNASGYDKDARDVAEHGLPCPKGGCKSRISVGDVKLALGEHIQCVRDLTVRLDAATKKEECAPPSFARTAGAASAEDQHTVAVRKFIGNVEEAFNLCCPGVVTSGPFSLFGFGKKSSCGGYLGPIEGCNAAVCENCKTSFCYLCLAPLASRLAAHTHVRDHSRDYWEMRDGHTGQVPSAGHPYTEFETYDVIGADSMPGGRRTQKETVPYTYKDRYHWLLIRKKLEALFHDEKDDAVKREAVVQLEPLLRKNKLWPLPFLTDRWIEAVMKDDKMNRRNKVALLQNEYIHQNRLATSAEGSATAPVDGARHRADRIAEKIRELHAPVLASLDVSADVSAAPRVNHNITPLLEDHEDAAVQHAFAHLREHAALFFAMGGANGNLYRVTDPEANPERRVPPFILSDLSPAGMSHEAATQYCRERRASLPTLVQLRALTSAMSTGGRYNPNLIPGMIGPHFWAADYPSYSSYPPPSPSYFEGTIGFVGFMPYHESHVRCVVPMPD